MKFKMKAMLIFNADNIDNAFEKLAKHFGKLAKDEDDENDCWFVGEIDIKQLENKKDLL